MMNDYSLLPGGDLLGLETGTYVVPWNSKLRPGEPLVLDIILPKAMEATFVRVDLAKIEWRRTQWAWQSGTVAQRHGGRLTVRFDKVSLPPGVYAVSRIGISPTDANATNEIRWVEAHTGFPRTFLVAIEEPLPTLSPTALRERVAAIERERQRLLYKGSIADAGAPGIGQFRACVLVARCLLTARMRLEDIDLLPLRDGLGQTEELTILNRLLVELGYRSQLPLGGPWLQRRKRDHPLTAIHFRLIRATSRDQVMKFVESLTSATLAVLSGHRLARGEVVGTFIESLDTGRAFYMPGYRPYQGNLLGGPISGEDPSHIDEQLARVKKDPILDLFSAMHAEAIGEREPNFGYLRYWNLLEAIATRRIAGTKTVADFSGAPLKDSAGNPVTTDQARGLVYELIRRHFATRKLSDATFQRQLGGKSLWEMCGAWLAFRNATAHFGGFRRDDSFQERHLRDWKVAEAAFDDIVARGARFGTTADPYLDILKESARLIVSWEIDGQAI